MATQVTILDEMLEPLAAVLTPEVAQVLGNLKATPSVQARVDQLAEKCNEGTLTDEEREEYEQHVRVGTLFSLIKAKAKQAIAESNHE